MAQYLPALSPSIWMKVSSTSRGLKDENPSARRQSLGLSCRALTSTASPVLLATVCELKKSQRPLRTVDS